MKKVIKLFFVGIIATAGIFLYSQTVATDYGYVIVRCTVSISVDVLDDHATAWFVAVGTSSALSANQTDVSITSIGVRNTSNGAVLKYAILVSTIQRSHDGINWIPDVDDSNSMIKGWYLTSDGILDSVGEFQLAAVFASSRPAVGEFQISTETQKGADEFRLNLGGQTPTTNDRQSYTYKTNGEDFDPSTQPPFRYDSALSNTAVNAVAPGTTRWLWFCVKTPSAVTDEFPRRIIIRVDGGLGSSW